MEAFFGSYFTYKVMIHRIQRLLNVIPLLFGKFAGRGPDRSVGAGGYLTGSNTEFVIKTFGYEFTTDHSDRTNSGGIGNDLSAFIATKYPQNLRLHPW